MKRNFKITESQYEYLMSGNYQTIDEDTAISDSNPSNDVTISKTNPTSSEKNNPSVALANTAKLATQNGININDPDVKLGTETNVNGKEMEITANQTNEGRLLSKEDIMRMRRDFLRENSREISFKKFLKNL